MNWIGVGNNNIFGIGGGYPYQGGGQGFGGYGGGGLQNSALREYPKYIEPGAREPWSMNAGAQSQPYPTFNTWGAPTAYNPYTGFNNTTGFNPNIFGGTPPPNYGTYPNNTSWWQQQQPQQSTAPVGTPAPVDTSRPGYNDTDGTPSGYTDATASSKLSSTYLNKLDDYNKYSPEQWNNLDSNTKANVLSKGARRAFLEGDPSAAIRMDASSQRTRKGEGDFGGFFKPYTPTINFPGHPTETPWGPTPDSQRLEELIGIGKNIIDPSNSILGNIIGMMTGGGTQQNGAYEPWVKNPNIDYNAPLNPTAQQLAGTNYNWTDNKLVNDNIFSSNTQAQAPVPSYYNPLFDSKGYTPNVPISEDLEYLALNPYSPIVDKKVVSNVSPTQLSFTPINNGENDGNSSGGGGGGGFTYSSDISDTDDMGYGL